VLFAHGATSQASARYIGEVFAVLCLGLVPYTIFQLQLRVFYAMHDSRTPAMIGALSMGVNIAACYVALALLPASHVVAGLAAGFGLGSLAGAVVAWLLLRRRLSGLEGRVIWSSLVRMHVAAIPAAVVALLITFATQSLLTAGRLEALVTVVVAGTGGAVTYVGIARLVRIPELADLARAVIARLRR
ncbi:MAG TPA: lipid II flippase MurJ, partial [Streptosporangiaceae bacterium]|nr:lipid II flippase MurJ [Streptosporangiaceae bacterium]